MNNHVVLSGRVKRSAQASTLEDGSRILDFAIAVWSEGNQRFDIFDCRTTTKYDAVDQLDGYLEEGEEVTIEGILEKRTTTEDVRACGVYLKVRSSQTVVFVTSIELEEE